MDLGNIEKLVNIIEKSSMLEFSIWRLSSAAFCTASIY